MGLQGHVTVGQNIFVSDQKFCSMTFLNYSYTWDFGIHDHESFSPSGFLIAISRIIKTMELVNGPLSVNGLHH